MASTNKPPEIPPRRHSSTVSLNKIFNQNSGVSQPGSPSYLSRRHSSCIDDNAESDTDTICVVLATCCFLAASAKPSALSYSYSLAENDPSSDCGKGSSDNINLDNSLYKVTGFQSNINHDIPLTYQYASGIKPIIAEPVIRMSSGPVQKYVTVTEAPILRTAQIEPARMLAAAPITNQLLQSRIIAEPLLKINHPVATSMQTMNRYEDESSRTLWKAPRIVSKYVTEAPILRHAEIEPARILAAAPVINPLLESRIVAKPLLKINRPIATSIQMMHKYEDEPTPALYEAPRIVSKYVTEAPVLRTAEIEPARLLSAAPITNQLLQSRTIAEPLLKINRPVATSVQMMNKYEDEPIQADWEVQRLASKYVTEAPILRTAEIEPARIITAAPVANQLLQSRIMAEPLLKINRPVATSVQMMNKYEDAPVPAYWEAPRIAPKYVTEAPILRTAEIEPARIITTAPVATAPVDFPLLEKRIVAEPLTKINHPLSFQTTNRLDSSLAWQYSDIGLKKEINPISSSYVQTYGIQNKFPLTPQYNSAAIVPQYYSNAIMPKYYAAATVPQYYSSGIEAADEKPC